MRIAAIDVLLVLDSCVIRGLSMVETWTAELLFWISDTLGKIIKLSSE